MSSDDGVQSTLNEKVDTIQNSKANDDGDGMKYELFIEYQTTSIRPSLSRKPLFRRKRAKWTLSTLSISMCFKSLKLEMNAAERIMATVIPWSG